MSESKKLREVSGAEVRQVIGGISYSDAYPSSSDGLAQQMRAKFDPSLMYYRIKWPVPPLPLKSN